MNIGSEEAIRLYGCVSDIQISVCMSFERAIRMDCRVRDISERKSLGFEGPIRRY